MQNIRNSAEPLNDLIHAQYEGVRDTMLAITNTNFGTGKLVLLGGVQINMPKPYMEHFEPLMFRVVDFTGETLDLLPELRYEHPDTGLDGSACGSTVNEKCYSVFSWLRWSPAPKGKCFETLQTCFPRALPGQAIVCRTAHVLGGLGLTPENTLYGESICPDEINGHKRNMPHQMAEYWGECFPMGGIGGAPFVGKTGFNAFAHHCPDDGHVLVVFGPHIAISEAGDLGQFLRPGQEHHSTACGAILAAYEACKRGEAGAYDEMDMEQAWLKGKIAQHLSRITDAAEPLNELIHYAYECVRDQMLAIVNNDWGNGKLVLLGGIQINMPFPQKDHFEPLLFKVRHKDGTEIDLIRELYVG